MLLEGKKVVIMGVRNKWSIAWGAAQSSYEQGAKVICTCSGDSLDKVKELGFSVDKSDEGLWLTFPKEEKNARVEEKVESMTTLKKRLYETLGLTKRRSQTEILGQETLEEQKDTEGKKRMQNIIYVIRNRRMLQEGGNR